ncbi:GNAT family N-acetyltransferase [Aureitalea sp. L0-47]|uniref:GNAT family N-acetyltransferase n=1 Tax=Aureitalea sp. L0-47 TaxID=2816962 RepID=UPI0022371627|nr:GNAT family N-acetyltransferase [Aureitalea sp. L0-47]MCW5520701.1 GNAT family N-acetyltransferase [Aureitalea sp. L0-47]
MEYHSDRFEDFSLLVFKEGKLFAVLPANKKGSRVHSHQGLTYGGFVLSEKAKLQDTFDAFAEVLKYLNEQGVQDIEIRMIPRLYHLVPSDEIDYLMHRAGGKLLKRDILMVLDYDHKIRFQKNRREGINKAVRHGLRVTIDDNIEGFWNEILIPNLQQKHDSEPVHTLEEIQLLTSRFPDNIKQVNVYNSDGNIVAGTTVFLTKTTVHPQYVSGNADKNKYGSLDLCYDFIINEFSEGRRYFNFNTSSLENGAALSAGLIFWKETCGARAHTIDNYLLPTASYKQLNIELR